MRPSPPKQSYPMPRGLRGGATAASGITATAPAVARVRCPRRAATPHTHYHWSATQTKATYGGLCGMPACGHAAWDVVSATRRRSGVTPRACVRVYARVLVPPNLYIDTYTIHYAMEERDPGP